MAWSAELEYAGLFAVACGLFALLDPSVAGVVLGLVVVGTGVALSLRTLVPRWGREAGLVAAVVVLLGTTSLVRITVAAEALAGLAALTLLLWAAADARRPRSFLHRAGGVVLPGLALAVAVVISGILSGTSAVVGGAVALLLAVVLWVAYVLSRPNPFRVRRRSEEEAS